MMGLHPVFHLSALEAAQFTHQDEPAKAASLIRQLTQGDVIITLGAQGAYLAADSLQQTIPAQAVPVVDTVGAGDAHIGALMAAEGQGLPLPTAVAWANRVSAAVVSQAGAELSPDAYARLSAQRP